MTLRPWRRRAAVLALVAAAVACAPVPPAMVQAPAAVPAGRGSSGINRPEHRGKPHLILVSFDAFRPDYLDRFDLPNFRRVLRRGTRARALIPVFPSLTFPNHYSLVTGLYPEQHGIVGNSFYDPETKKTYGIRDAAAVGDGSFYRGEPIWVTAETQGMVTACYFWPGSEAPINGVRPTFWTRYDAGVAARERVDQVLRWLRLPDAERPHFITLYFSELDTTAHQLPLDAPEVAAVVQSLDDSLGLLLDGIDAMRMRDQVYLLLTSDHGMQETSVPQTVLLGSLVEPERLVAAFGGPVAALHVKGGPEERRAVRDQIRARLTRGRVYLREEIPEHYHYKADPRIGDILIVMDEGWSIATSAFTRARPQARWGSHGWDPVHPSMRALFVAAGPGVREEATIGEVRNVDVYPFMAELLGLRPAAGIAGRPGVLRQMVTSEQ